MKKLLFFIAAFIFAHQLFSQNVGIGTTEPFNKLHISGNLLVNTPVAATNTTPTVPQTKTMANASTITFAAADSTGRIYDPGGPAGNYNANQTANVDIAPSSNVGFELIAETMQLGIGDSLFIGEFPGSSNLLAVGNGYSTTGKWIFNTGIGTLYITFKSNADANVGSGFSFLFRRLYDNSQSLPDVNGYAGKALSFDTKSGAFRTGSISNLGKGFYSTAMGEFPYASGYSSTAIGGFSSASGNYSTAIGNAAVSSGYTSTALGSSVNAKGDYSTAFGRATLANGDYSTALGYKTKANGIKSTALGDSTLVNGDNATALGYHTIASADYSTAMGILTTASGVNSTALGIGTVASGVSSNAFGAYTTASGLRSTAMGSDASTNGHAKSFCIGGAAASVSNSADNQMMMRFDNYTFWITPSNYAYLLPSSNGWAYTSDKNKKERFEELNGETVLNKLAAIPYYSWNFRDSTSRQYRHYGIMAQDFYDAFGKDSYGKIGNDTTVSPLDMMGVAYSAIKALEKRTAEQQEKNLRTIKENELLKSDNIALQNRLNMLEAKLNKLILLKDKGNKNCLVSTQTQNISIVTTEPQTSVIPDIKSK